MKRRAIIVLLVVLCVGIAQARVFDPYFISKVDNWYFTYMCDTTEFICLDSVLVPTDSIVIDTIMLDPLYILIDTIKVDSSFIDSTNYYKRAACKFEALGDSLFDSTQAFTGHSSYRMEVPGDTDIWSKTYTGAAYQVVQGDFTISARIDSGLYSGGTWTKAGLFMRDDFVSPNSFIHWNGVCPGTDSTAGKGFVNLAIYDGFIEGALSVGTPADVVNPPGIWLRLQRTGNIITSSYSRNGIVYAPLAFNTPSQTYLDWETLDPDFPLILCEYMAVGIHVQSSSSWDSSYAYFSDIQIVGTVIDVDTFVVAGADCPYAVGIKSSPNTAASATGLQLRPVMSRGVAFSVRVPQAGPFTLSMRDVLGRSIWSRRIVAANGGEHHVSVNARKVSKGTYFVILDHDGRRIVRKMTNIR